MYKPSAKYSIFTAECIAVREAIKFVKVMPNINQILICTDLNIITAINGFPKNKKY